MTAPLVSTTDRPFQLLPPLDSEQRHILKQSIKENGVLEPVVFDEDGEILDGHHRVEIAEALGIDYPRRVIFDLDRPGKFAYALTVNVARRHLTQADRSGLVAQLRLRNMSIRDIAKTLGVPKTTVARDLAQVSQAGQLPDTVTGLDGKSYAATRPTPKTPEPAADPSTAPAGSGSISVPDVSPSASGADPAPAAGPAADSPEPDRHLSDVPDPPKSPPGSPAAWTAEERAANQREIDRKRLIADGQKAARNLVMSVQAEIGTVVSAIDLGEKDLINAEMIAKLRRAVDLLESRLEASK